MANLSSIARPYALAAFEIARDKEQLSGWKGFLTFASVISKNKDVVRLLKNPEFSSANAFDLYSQLLTQVTPEQNNFLLLLSQNKRLLALPEISEAFNAYYSALEKISTVRVVTALKTEKEFNDRLEAALTKRIKHKVKIKSEVDPAIMGGAVIHIGDRVIDGSIRGKLARLLEFSLR